MLSVFTLHISENSDYVLYLARFAESMNSLSKEDMCSLLTKTTVNGYEDISFLTGYEIAVELFIVGLKFNTLKCDFYKFSGFLIDGLLLEE